MTNYGLRFGMNLKHNIQIEATAGSYSFSGTPTYKIDSEDEEGQKIDAKWDELFEGRTPAYFDIVLRFLF